jgi:L-threonylcarbamoyladenylate synthase
MEELEAPLAAPSANPFGYVSPSCPEHVASSFGERVPFILDGGPCDVGLESTILDLTSPGQAEILRPGVISREEIASLLPIPVFQRQVSLSEKQAATAPGTMHRHYSPQTRLILFDEGKQPDPEAAGATLFLQRPASAGGSDTFWLSEDGDPGEIAKALFAMLRSLDGAGYRSIHCESPDASSTGVMLAVRDRLRRAASAK